jgi:hypothetical protein
MGILDRSMVRLTAFRIQLTPKIQETKDSIGPSVSVSRVDVVRKFRMLEKEQYVQKEGDVMAVEDIQKPSFGG